MHGFLVAQPLRRYTGQWTPLRSESIMPDDVFAPIAETGVRPVTEFTASSLKSDGVVLDAADKGIVRITRRSQRFILISEDQVTAFVADAVKPEPRTLADLLEGFDSETAAGLRGKMSGWLANKPQGGELI